MGGQVQRRVLRRVHFSPQAREEIMGAIWREYYAKLMVFISAGSLLDTAATREDREDAVAEIMLKVLANIHRYDPRFSLSTWIYSIARNHCIDARRRRGVRARHCGPFPEEEPPACEAGPEERLFAREDERLTADYLHGLSDSERQIAYLRFAEGMSYAEIARVLEVPAGTAKYRVHEIRRGLKDALEQGSPRR